MSPLRSGRSLFGANKFAVKSAARTAWNPDLAHELPVAVIAPGEETTVHLRNLGISTALSRHYVKNFIPPEAVIDVLNAARVRFVLAGAHMIGGWMNQSRTTDDVDVLVAARQVKTAVLALRRAFPRLEVTDNPIVTRFSNPKTQTVVIDVMKPNQALFQVLWRHTRWIETPKRTYRIPNLEFALAMKFAAMVSPNRRPLKKRQDAVDSGNIVLANPAVALEKLARLGERVYRGGGREIIAMVRQVRAEEGLEL